MITIKNFLDNDDIEILDTKGPFKVLEYRKDLSVTPGTAELAFYCNAMNVRKRQVYCEVTSSNGITIQAGAMQWFTGDVKATTGITGAADFLKKAVKGSVTGESTIKPEYIGDGILVLEPTYKHLILETLDTWGGSVVLDDGIFLACESKVKQSVVARSNASSALLGKEGLFNLCLKGEGAFVLESKVPREELIEVILDNDTIKIDGNFAVAWSNTLEFTVERSGKSLVGSAASGEGLVNVYRGTGKLLMAPVASTPVHSMGSI